MPTLAERLRSQTRTLHTAAERSRFMGELLHGRMQRDAYGALLRNLHAIYSALEPALARHAGHPGIAPVLAPGLWREPALRADLVARHGPRWAESLPLMASARAYADRLRELEHHHPERLLAHAYVRYLGDLNGGQALRRIVDGSLGLEDGTGSSFYDFGDKSSTLALLQGFRDGLARIGGAIDGQAEDDLVAEALLAFEMHQRLFDELASACL